MKAAFDYGRAFSRNIGWVTDAEQGKLRNARVAIAGLGGVGGAHLLTLARLGISKFHLADFDEFDVHNMNRQVGSFMSTVGQKKIEVMAALAADINPEVELKMFPRGVQLEDIDEFLKDVDIYVDGLDFFVLDIRRKVFERCREKGIHAVTAAPLGMGVSFLYFDPQGMAFEDYFRLGDQPVLEQYARFAVGLSPAMLNRGYLVAPEAVNFVERRGPSTSMACQLCAGVLGSAVLKLILGRGGVRAVPWAMQFDAYRAKLKFTWRPFGNANPLQQLMLMFVRPLLKGRSQP